MRYSSCVLFVCVAFVLSSGCQRESPSTPGTSTGPSGGGDSEDSHAHPSEGPHHGTLVELGNEEYHAELVHDDASVTIYILDATAAKAVPIDAKEVTINLTHDGMPKQYQLPADADKGDPDGKSSRFMLADSDLVSQLEDEAAAPKLVLSIDGTPYRGEIEHDHDHAH